MRTDRLPFILAPLFLFAYFLSLAGPALYAYFSPDDLMNLYRSWQNPLPDLVKANILFFRPSDFFRPMGSDWYRSIFFFADFNPFPFHAASLAIILANLFLLYSVSRRLTSSREVAVLSALTGAYHASFAGLYFDTGYIYDVLSYFFYFSAFLFYLRIRQAGRRPAAPELAICCILYICALNSKEIAVTLTACLLSYEVLYHPARFRDRGCWAAIAATGVITLLFLAGVAGNTALLSNPAYQPVFSAARFMETSRHFLDALFYQEGWFSSTGVILLWAAMLVPAWRAKQPGLRFAWLFIMLSVLPVAFIPPRGASQYYLPSFGWVLFLAIVLVKGSNWLLRGRLSRPRAAALFLALAFLLWPCHRRRTPHATEVLAAESAAIRTVAEQMHRARPWFDPGAHVLFLNDPIDPHFRYDLLFIAQLSYRDDTLRVDRLKTMDHQPSGIELACYDDVLDFRGGRFVDQQRPPCPSGIPRIGPEVLHADFVPVSAARPAAGGEWLIAKATGLGPTLPDVPAGAPFPRNPLARVLATVSATVNGRMTEVRNALGWPDQAGIYRVDFRVPEETGDGTASVRLKVSGITGPPGEIAVDKGNFPSVPGF